MANDLMRGRINRKIGENDSKKSKSDMHQCMVKIHSIFEHDIKDRNSRR